MKKKGFLLFFAALMFSSCVGVSMEIALRQDGSGTIALEYRLSRELEYLGKLDGNENWPSIPVGKADFERSAARIEGLSLRSFSESAAPADRVYQAKLDFSNLEALLMFLDSSGQRASLVREGGRNRLVLSFNDSVGRFDVDRELLDLAAAIFEGYALDFGIALPRTPELRLSNGSGGFSESPPAGTALVQGNRVSFSAAMADLFSAQSPALLEIIWRDD
ncbi:MAG: hypothetical protein LBK63_10680 [Treponema sp.]|jgi:hypothetical protein|nr:hypothetical protein [Treponema sp.]